MKHEPTVGPQTNRPALPNQTVQRSEMAEPAPRPQSQPAGTGSGGLDCLAPSKGGSGTRPQTAQVRMPEAPRAARAAFRPPVSRPQSTSSIRPGSTAGFDPALTARTPPWVFTQSVDPLSNLMLKKEYMAMADKAREDELFVQKLNKHNPPPQVTHMKKDWRYYQHCGSKGNVWSDLHMTPEDRRHLVVTPTVLKGYDVQMGARPMARLIQDKIKRPLAEEILFGELAEHGGLVHVDLKGDELAFEFEITAAEPA